MGLRAAAAAEVADSTTSGEHTGARARPPQLPDPPSAPASPSPCASARSAAAAAAPSCFVDVEQRCSWGCPPCWRHTHGAGQGRGAHTRHAQCLGRGLTRALPMYGEGLTRALPMFGEGLTRALPMFV